MAQGMARKPPRLKVNITPSARRDLNKIWEWNAEDKSPAEAGAYEDFLISQIERLATTYLDGREVSVAPGCRYASVKKSKRGHGHYVIYLVTSSSVEVLRLYHTRQDWENRFREGR
jgi:plasmid stabilization system protein ParE